MGKQIKRNKTYWGQSAIEPLLKTLMALGASIIIRLFKWSWLRSLKVIPSETQALLDAKKTVIYAIWHGQLYVILKNFNAQKTAFLVSPSRDGEFISKTSAFLGYHRLIRGSTKRNGTQALREMITQLTEENRSITFTVDGPKGPYHQVKPGIIKLASLAQVPIIPVIPASRFFYFKFNSWDRFEIPSLFTPMRTFYGKPFYVPRELTDEEEVQFREDFESRMLTLTATSEEFYSKSFSTPSLSQSDSHLGV